MGVRSGLGAVKVRLVFDLWMVDIALAAHPPAQIPVVTTTTALRTLGVTRDLHLQTVHWILNYVRQPRSALYDLRARSANNAESSRVAHNFFQNNASCTLSNKNEEMTTYSIPTLVTQPCHCALWFFDICMHFCFPCHPFLSIEPSYTTG